MSSKYDDNTGCKPILHGTRIDTGVEEISDLSATLERDGERRFAFIAAFA